MKRPFASFLFVMGLAGSFLIAQELPMRRGGSTTHENESPLGRGKGRRPWRGLWIRQRTHPGGLRPAAPPRPRRGFSSELPDNPEAIRHMQSAIEAHKSKRLDTAATEYETVIKLAPNFAEAYMNLGLVRES